MAIAFYKGRLTMQELSIGSIEDYFSTPWDFGNQVLYDLCSENPFHTDDEVIIAKTLFIGRIYAAAIERGRKKANYTETGDNLYITTVVNLFKKSDLDNELKLISNKKLNAGSINDLLRIHKKLVDMLKTITGQEKRSFASKYLHFHFPDLFFIYDSRAIESIEKYFDKGNHKAYPYLFDLYDVKYAEFFCKCYELQKKIKSMVTCPDKITPRVIDNFLIR